MKKLYLENLANELHETAVSKGFYDDQVNIHFILGKLALVHSEVSEVLEAVRKSQGDEKVVEEMADIIIRLLDLYAGMKEYGWIAGDVYLDEILANKANVNSQRPQMHGNLA